MIIPVSKQGTKADGTKYSYNQTEMCDLIVNEDTWDVTLGSERSRKGNTKIKVTCGKKTIMVRIKVV